MPEDMIRVEGLSHRFDDLVAVDDVSFHVRPGEVFSFLGPNGAGKSTVINVLTTLLPLQEGRVVIAGFDLRTEPDRVRSAIGIVFQEVTLDRDMTVTETLLFHGRLYGLPRGELRERTAELVRLVELETKRDVLVKHLSGGMKRRLEIARGLMTRPTVLFLDEPTIGLDPQTRARMWDYLRDVNRDGTTIFLTTHYMDEADRLSDRIAIIDRGRIIAEDTPLDLKNALGRDLVYLETTDNGRARTVLEADPSVTGVREKGPAGLLVTVSEDGTRVVPRLLDSLRENGVAIDGLNIKKPSMDDVFIHHTGRALRDEGAESFAAAVGRRR
ncbi:MAG TPA: ATP-binding cassette domain-containing protein [Methanoregulaceae archaeon]|nr:ATP-binding cassette domain-containing protein [Methanoregulaceae archaeon]